MIFDSISSNIDEVLLVSPASNVFVFGDFNVHHKDRLTYSGGTDRSGELCYNFSISNDIWINLRKVSFSLVLKLFLNTKFLKSDLIQDAPFSLKLKAFFWLSWLVKKYPSSLNLSLPRFIKLQCHWKIDILKIDIFKWLDWDSVLQPLSL